MVNTDEQKARFYAGDEQVGWTTVASGLSKYPTPTGHFEVMEKVANKRSNLYGKIVSKGGKVVRSNATDKDRVPAGARFEGASMPYFMRLTYDGIGLHAGPIPRPGRPASHGCIRMPKKLAPVVFKHVDVGTRVSIVGTGPSYGNYAQKQRAIAAERAARAREEREAEARRPQSAPTATATASAAPAPSPSRRAATPPASAAGQTTPQPPAAAPAPQRPEPEVADASPAPAPLATPAAGESATIERPAGPSPEPTPAAIGDAASAEPAPAQAPAPVADPPSEPAPAASAPTSATIPKRASRIHASRARAGRGRAGGTDRAGAEHPRAGGRLVPARTTGGAALGIPRGAHARTAARPRGGTERASAKPGRSARCGGNGQAPGCIPRRTARRLIRRSGGRTRRAWLPIRQARFAAVRTAELENRGSIARPAQALHDPADQGPGGVVRKALLGLQERELVGDPGRIGLL